MPSSMNWVDGAAGGTPVSAANLNKLAVTADVGTAGTPTGDAVRAASVPKWKPSTAYASGEFVLNPSGQIVSANATFTSGATYSAANWTIVTGGTVADATTGAKGIVQLAGDLAGTAAAPTVPGLSGKLAAASNLSDLANAATARTNLGLGTAATSATSAFDTAGAAATAQANAIAAIPPAPSGTTVGVFYVDPTNGNDASNGRSWQTAVATISAALTLCAAQSAVGEIRLGRGIHNVTATLVIPQAVKLRGFGSLISQETEIVWTGADDGSYVIRTAGDTSGNDFSRGELSGFLLRPNATKPGGGAYTNLNGLYARNMQNGAYLSNLRIQNFPGTGLNSDWANAAVPAGAFPGWVTFERIWSTGNNVNWHVSGGFTSVFYNMCAGDISSNTTDVFILDPPTGGTVLGRQGNHVFIGFKTEDNGTPTGAGATANYFTINSDAAVSFIGCSAKRGVDSGTKPWINYTATPGSFHAEPRQIPVSLVNCETSNISTTVQGPGPVTYLAPVSATSGQVFQVDMWSSKLFPPAGATPKLRDGFVRVDSATVLGSTERGGQAWTTVGTWGVLSSQAYTSVSTANSTAVADSGLADCSVEVTFSVVNANAQRLVFRYTDTNNYLYVNVGGSVFTRIAGAETNIGSTSAISWAAGDVMRLTMIGSTLWLYKNGQRARVPLTGVTFNQTATMHGIGCNSNTVGRFDDFSVTPI